MAIRKERILIVEDNKALAKLMARKMEHTVDMDVDIAHSMAEAEDLIEDYGDDYFISLLDLNLPDAPYGEIVDFVISKGILAIVLTGNIDEETKKLFINKDIVDYVYKSNMDDVNYIFSMINRLSKNRNHKVMVVDDSIPVRTKIKNILLSQQFQVFAAAHGEEALAYFKDNPDIKFVLTDYNMPVIDGMELVRQLREKYDKNDLSIIALTSTDDVNVAARFLKIGANDFIIKPFAKEELICRINNTIENMENIATIANFANKDFLTGLSNRRHFFDQMNEYLASSNQSFAVAMMDIDFFKKINDTYGHDVGDLVLKALANMLTLEAKGGDILARFGGEEFCIVLKNISKENAVKWFVMLRSKIAKMLVHTKEKDISLTVSIGVCFPDTKIKINDMLEFADKALYQAKENGRNRVEIYE